MNRRFALALAFTFAFSLCPALLAPLGAQEKTPASPPAAATAKRFFEMRTYHTEPGRFDALLARFRDHTVKLFEKHGITNLGYWVPEKGDGNTLIYLLSYPDQAARDASWKAFLGDADWQAAKAASEKDGKIVAKVETQFLVPTDYTPETIPASTAGTPRQFELRIYTTLPGQLPKLHARFRDHTMKLFEKHGMTNVVYTVPAPGQPGADTTLVYLLAHRDDAARQASFAAFRADPVWIEARGASEKDGPILVKDGVKSIPLKTVDFSPLR